MKLVFVMLQFVYLAYHNYYIISTHIIYNPYDLICFVLSSLGPAIWLITIHQQFKSNIFILCIVYQSILLILNSQQNINNISFMENIISVYNMQEPFIKPTANVFGIFMIYNNILN